MTESTMIMILVVVAAVGFDFVNGFHDAANSIATLVATRTLSPRRAVLWAAVFNFAALFVFGTGVAKTVGSGMVALDTVTPTVFLCGLLGAILWGLLTWWKGIPASSSHALLGGYAGAAICNCGFNKGWAHAGDAIVLSGWAMTLLFIVVAPMLGLFLGHGLMRLTMKLNEKTSLGSNHPFYGHAQLASSAFLSLMHGSNDAQKTAGIIAGALVAGGYLKEFTISPWVLWVSYCTMGLGTFAGGWRIVRTMGHNLTRLKPGGGFCAETSSALSILLATLLHLPISTTHVTVGSILGVGSARNPRAVRWSLAGRIVWAWVFTIPAAAALSAAFMGIAVYLSQF